MKTYTAIMALVVVLAGCAGPGLQTQATPIIQTVVVTQIVQAPTLAPLPTYTPYPTYTPVPPVIVTATPIPATPTPIGTPTFTPSPTVTPNVAKTATAEARLILPKSDGFYLVNVDIAPGVWRSQGTSTNCNWKRTTKTGDVINMHYGQAGGTIYISSDDFQVQFSRCGTWVYLGQ